MAKKADGKTRERSPLGLAASNYARSSNEVRTLDVRIELAKVKLLALEKMHEEAVTNRDEAREALLAAEEAPPAPAEAKPKKKGKVELSMRKVSE